VLALSTDNKEKRVCSFDYSLKDSR
jgi:hypothetical protein